MVDSIVVMHMTQRSICKPTAFPSGELAQLINTFFPFFDEKLRNELHMLNTNKLFHKPPGELVLLLAENDLQGTLSEVHELLQLMLKIPASSTLSFSCLKRIKILSEEHVWTGQTCQLSQNIHWLCCCGGPKGQWEILRHGYWPLHHHERQENGLPLWIVWVKSTPPSLSVALLLTELPMQLCMQFLMWS